MMGWPFIHHRTHQRVVADLVATRAELRDTTMALTIERAARTATDLQIAAERTLHQMTVTRHETQFSDLLKQFTELRIAGAQSTPELRPALPKAEPPSRIEQAFSIAMQGRPYAIQMGARQQLAKDEELLKLGIIDEDSLVHKILHGEETDGVP